ncbi:MAG: hypothetical protein AVDCRST_MAG08-1292 [uncultured Acetobacteraceae bacterium]|uniref:Uncharacterized protein n=1 Tax=uncultured Acetobacteraceae bacterium TaxID=169975 RepID=A0A6J4HUP0_9PROT|nr:MAG: hypothetical protein AVDCRST_MAG08-1292 [uncultured Acetobacteraceae bacterium]
MPPLPGHFNEAPRARWTDVELRQWFARLPARERRRMRWAAIHAGCAGTEWQRRLLGAAKFLLALPVGFYLFMAGLGLSSPGFSLSPMWLISVLFWLPRFGAIFLVFALVFLVVREWAVRTARVPLDDEFEMLLNRVCPLRRRTFAAGPPSVLGADGDDPGIGHLAERAAP